MPAKLIQRYTYGNFADLPSASPDADFFLEVPVRQRELLNLAKLQVQAHSQAANRIVEGQAEAADMIRRELHLQTETLESAIAAGSDAVVMAITAVGDRIAGELGGIRWELAQLRSLSEQVIAILKRPRSTEAQELLTQGASNLANDKLEQAEERFKRALILDNTDYQVLMNLSVVELRKDNARLAISYAQDALTLPINLDTHARAEALWHLSRIHYAAESYRQAFANGTHSVTILPQPRRLLQTGIYAILAGDQAEGLHILVTAVRQEPPLFALAISTPDLQDSRTAVVASLTPLMSQAVTQFRHGLDTLRSEVDQVRRLQGVSPTLMSQLDAILASLEQLTHAPGYSECRRALSRLELLKSAPADLRRLAEAEVHLLASQKAESQATEERQRAHKKVEELIKRPGCIASLVGIIGYFALALVLAPVVQRLYAEGHKYPFGVLVLGILVTAPFWIGIPVYAIISKVRREAESGLRSAEGRAAAAHAAALAAANGRDQLAKEVTCHLRTAD